MIARLVSIGHGLDAHDRRVATPELSSAEWQAVAIALQDAELGRRVETGQPYARLGRAPVSEETVAEILKRTSALQDRATKHFGSSGIPMLEGNIEMADNKSDVGSPDRDRIAMGEEHEVSYWTKALGVTKERLQQAVDTVGNSAAKVREHLKG